MPVGTIGAQREGDVSVVAVTGEHDLSSAPELERHLEAAVAEGTPIVVDLSEATFIDSSILRTLISGRERAHQAGLGFSVHLDEQGSAAVRRVLDVTGLAPLLLVRSARGEAIGAAAAGPPTTAAG